jgi:hypothetical protein
MFVNVRPTNVSFTRLILFLVRICHIGGVLLPPALFGHCKIFKNLVRTAAT